MITFSTNGSKKGRVPTDHKAVRPLVFRTLVQIDLAVIPAESASFSQRFLCLSRADLGNKTAFSITKWLQKRHSPHQRLKFVTAVSPSIVKSTLTRSKCPYREDDDDDAAAAAAADADDDDDDDDGGGGGTAAASTLLPPAAV